MSSSVVYNRDYSYRGSMDGDYYWNSYGYNDSPYEYYDFDPIRVQGGYTISYPRPYTYAYGEFPDPLVVEKPNHVAPRLGGFATKYIDVPQPSNLSALKPSPHRVKTKGTPSPTSVYYYKDLAGIGTVTLVVLLIALFVGGS